MAVATYPLPEFHFPKRLVAAVAVAAGLTIAGVAVINNDTTTSATGTEAGAVTQSVASPADPQVIGSGAQSHLADLAQIGGPVAIDQTGAAAHAQANGLSGLSPASAAPIDPTQVGSSTASAVDMTGAADFALTNGLSGLSPASAAPVTTSPTVDGTNSGYPEGYAERVEAQYSGTATTTVEEIAPRANFASDAEWIAANGWGPSVSLSTVPTTYLEAAKAAGGTVEASDEGVQPRTNFASDTDWIEANGFGPR